MVVSRNHNVTAHLMRSTVAQETKVYNCMMANIMFPHYSVYLQGKLCLAKEE